MGETSCNEVEPYRCEACSKDYDANSPDLWTSCDYCAKYLHNSCFPRDALEGLPASPDQVLSGNHKLKCHACARARSTDLYSLGGSVFHNLRELGESVAKIGNELLREAFPERPSHGGIYKVGSNLITAVAFIGFTANCGRSTLCFFAVDLLALLTRAVQPMSYAVPEQARDVAWHCKWWASLSVHSTFLHDHSAPQHRPQGLLGLPSLFVSVVVADTRIVIAQQIPLPAQMQSAGLGRSRWLHVLNGPLYLNFAAHGPTTSKPPRLA